MDMSMVSDVVVVTLLGVLIRYSAAQNNRMIDSLSENIKDLQNSWTALKEDVYEKIQDVTKIASSGMSQADAREYMKELNDKSNQMTLYRLDRIEESVDTLSKKIEVVILNGKQNK